MMVTPVAKRPHRLSKCGRINRHVVQTLFPASLFRTFLQKPPTNRLHYHAMPLYHSIQVTVRTIADASLQTGSAPVGALDEIQPGVPISRELALRLITCPDADLPSLLAAARAAKERFKPGVITYSRKVFIPLTNLCRDYCGYCTFRRDPGRSRRTHHDSG